jgi:hypothetical protein
VGTHVRQTVTYDSTWRLTGPVLELGSHTGLNNEGDTFILDVHALVHFSNEDLLTWDFDQEDLEYITETGLSISTVTGTVNAGFAATMIQAWVFSGDLENGQETHAMMDLRYTTFLEFEEHGELDYLDDGDGRRGKRGGGQGQAILAAWCPEHPCDDPPPPGDKEKNIPKANEAIAAFNAAVRPLNEWNQAELQDINDDYDEDMGNCESTFNYCVLKTSILGGLTLGAGSGFGTSYLDCIDNQKSCFKNAANRRDDRASALKALYETRLAPILADFEAALDAACEDCPVQVEMEENVEPIPK